MTGVTTATAVGATEGAAGGGATGRRPELTEVADGVFAYVQPDGGWCLNNAGLILSGDRAALVDTAATETRARGLREAVLSVAPAAPQVLVNTHFHGDHTFGNFVFPEALVVGHERARTEMTEAGLHLTGLWPDVEWGALELVPPALTFRDRLTLHIGDKAAEVLHLGPAHTSNDTVVWLPAERVLFTGDLVMNGVTPFCPMGSVAGSLEALDTMRALAPEVVVTGHGPVAGPGVFDETEAYLRLLQDLARQGLAEKLDPVALARRTDLGRYARWLDAERLVPNLFRAYAEEQGEPRGSRVDMSELFRRMVEYHGGLPTCHA
ncbi:MULTISPECIES: MBL fold metallo-hydrolase [Streptomyces]|uniref:MBL fold metallo-hydrolase n=1 Tax=Streptomyces lateritius TaxID=67313 RepID=A0ABW6Y6R5_9ACTN|nr:MULTISPECIES: MBL fold metallo-hydrolase [Streptomyces]QJD07443.1 cyclase [Streptomyces sp.]GGT68480.1 MBL fold metallo-hydrolase [Streptomyces lateritius]